MTFQIKLQIWFNWGLAYLSCAMIDYCDDDQNSCTAGLFYTCSVQPSRGGTPTIMVHVNGILPYKDNTCMSFTSADHLSGLFSEWCHLFILDLFYMPISCCSNKWYCNDDFRANVVMHIGHIIHIFAGLERQWCRQCRFIFPLDWKPQEHPRHLLSCWLCLLFGCELFLEFVEKSFTIWYWSLYTIALWWFFRCHRRFTGVVSCISLHPSFNDASRNKVKSWHCKVNL
jgi:hypothetical protein